jgi:hypothetical protein
MGGGLAKFMDELPCDIVVVKPAQLKSLAHVNSRSQLFALNFSAAFAFSSFRRFLNQSPKLRVSSLS